MTIQVYSYLERDAKGQFFRTSYSIRKGVKPLGFMNEKLVDEFDINYIPHRDIDVNKSADIIEFDSRF